MENKKSKRLVITALSILLSAAVAMRATENDGKDHTAKPSSGATAKSPEKKTASGAAVDIRHLNWPEANLPDVLSFSPFGLAKEPKADPAAKSPEAKEATGDLAQLQSKSTVKTNAQPASSEVRFVGTYTHMGRTVALIDSRIVEIGDRLDDGSLVLDIADRKVVVRPPPQFVAQEIID